MIDVINIFDGEAIAASDNIESSIVNLNDLPLNSKLELDVKVTGDGTVKGEAEYGISNSDSFFIPSGVSDIFTGHTKTTNTNGRDIYKVATDYITNKMKFKFTETGGSNSATVTINLIIWSANKF